MKLDIQLLDPRVPVPEYATDGSAGIDLIANINERTVIAKHCRIVVPTGIKVKIPTGCVGDIRSRSGLASRSGIIVLNSPGTIDSDYRGELGVILYNSGEYNYSLEPRTRIAQLVILPCPKLDINIVNSIDIEEGNNRGVKGFGSTGINTASIDVDRLKGYYIND